MRSRGVTHEPPGSVDPPRPRGVAHPRRVVGSVELGESGFDAAARGAAVDAEGAIMSHGFDLDRAAVWSPKHAFALPGEVAS